MNTITLDKKFFMGGNATFTVDNGKGTHYTFKIRQPKQSDRFTGTVPHFVSMLTGPDNTSNYTYMGIVYETPIVERIETEIGKFTTYDSGRKMLSVRLTSKSRYKDDSVPVKVIRWILKLVTTGGSMPEGYKVHHEGKCGCCGRALTVPESIERGIGPECWSRLGGM